MAQPPDEGFRVTDRRQRDMIEAPAPSAAQSAPPRPASPVPSETPHDAPDARSLVGLFMMLATEAVIALGEAPDPVTGQRQRELPHAAAVIDLLTVLRDKTEGHRSAEETRMLDDLIYDLQLRYVKATKSSE
jgi:Domain of unknown function (DUF1844)